MTDRLSAVDMAARRIDASGQGEACTRPTAVEAPVAIEFDGFGYAVMMATPADLADYVQGFALAERLVERWQLLSNIDVVQVEQGWIVRASLPPESRARLQDRVRVRVAEGSCGLCGLESLEQVLRPLPAAANADAIAPAAIFRALDALFEHQPLNRLTGATHVAAFCAPDGAILIAREDVGRHNAFDKLTGALAHAGIDPAIGFALASSRCSYEMVEKAVLGGFPMLVTISAATDLAVRRAREAGLHLVVLARPDSLLEM